MLNLCNTRVFLKKLYYIENNVGHVIQTGYFTRTRLEEQSLIRMSKC